MSSSAENNKNHPLNNEIEYENETNDNSIHNSREEEEEARNDDPHDMHTTPEAIGLYDSGSETYIIYGSYPLEGGGLNISYEIEEVDNFSIDREAETSTPHSTPQSPENRKRLCSATEGNSNAKRKLFSTDVSQEQSNYNVYGMNGDYWKWMQPAASLGPYIPWQCGEAYAAGPFNYGPYYGAVPFNYGPYYGAGPLHNGAYYGAAPFQYGDTVGSFHPCCIPNQPVYEEPPNLRLGHWIPPNNVNLQPNTNNNALFDLEEEFKIIMEYLEESGAGCN